MVDDDLIYPEEAVQKRALDLYCENATPDNNYKALSYQKISDHLYSEEFENCSKSQVDRWAKIFNFKKHLDKKIELAYISSDSKEISTRVKNKSTQDIADRLKENGEMTDDLYMVCRIWINDIKADLAEGKRIDKDRMKLVKDLLVLGTTREDKLLDRFAEQGGDKLSSKQMMEEFGQIEISLEEENIIDVDVDVEEE